MSLRRRGSHDDVCARWGEMVDGEVDFLYSIERGELAEMNLSLRSRRMSLRHHHLAVVSPISIRNQVTKFRTVDFPIGASSTSRCQPVAVVTCWASYSLTPDARSRRCTPWRRAKARIDMPWSRAPRRVPSNCSTLDLYLTPSTPSARPGRQTEARRNVLVEVGKTKQAPTGQTGPKSQWRNQFYRIQGLDRPSKPAKQRTLFQGPPLVVPRKADRTPPLPPPGHRLCLSSRCDLVATRWSWTERTFCIPALYENRCP
jgi:hypothetical protein